MRLAMMMLVLVAASSARAEQAGGTVENGGKLLFCTYTADITGGGEVDVADYIRALETGYRAEDFVDVADWDTDQARITGVLGRVSAKLEATFRDFALSTKQIGVPGNRDHLTRTWAVRTQQEIDWVTSHWQVPRRCYVGYDTYVLGSVVEFYGPWYLRAVTRRQSGSSIEYAYDPTLLGYLHPLQRGILLTHEWLWDHTPSLDVNQAVSVFLHRRDLEQMSGREIRARLRAFGLRF